MRGQHCSVWHDRRELHIKAWEDREGLKTMGASLAALVGEVGAVTGLDRVRLGLGGFSQGGHMALHCVYGQGLEVGCCFALSSFLCRDTVIMEEVHRQTTPLFLSTGDADSMVEPDWVDVTRKVLEDAGVVVEHSVVPGLGHDMGSVQLDRLFTWAGQRLE